MSHYAEFIIPGLSEATDEGGAKETIEREVEFLAFLACRRTNVPAVIVKANEAASEALLADGIKGAGDGLREAGAAVAADFLQCAEASAARRDA